MNKIFCIGLSKTGTSSLNAALEILGFKAIHFPFMSYQRGKLILEPNHVAEYDAFSDTPVANCFKYLDKTYSDSKFIYTVRDKESWLRSCENHYKRTPLTISLVHQHFKWVHLQYSLYGCLNFDRNKFSAAYDKHDFKVKEHFNGSDKLLVLDICSGEGWEKICPFLDQAVPTIPLPKSNVTALKQAIK